MPSIDLYVNYGVHGVRDCSRPAMAAMAMDGIQYLREVRGRPPPVESVGLLTGGPDRRRPGSIYTTHIGQGGRVDQSAPGKIATPPTLRWGSGGGCGYLSGKHTTSKLS